MVAGPAEFTSFWRDLDARTEYFDVYGLPENENVMPAASSWMQSVFPSWANYAKAQEGAGDQQQLLIQFSNAVNAKRDDVSAIDGLLRQLVAKYFSAASGVDTAALFDCFGQFGADLLPTDSDRLARIQALNDPNDPRLSEASRHRMDSAPMWFFFAGAIESSVILFGNTDAYDGVRSALLGAICVGSAMDFVFRNRGKTRPEYYPQPQGKAALLTRVNSSIAASSVIRREVHKLFQIFSPSGFSPKLFARHSYEVSGGTARLMAGALANTTVSFDRVQQYLDIIGKHAAFSPHGKFWDVDYQSFKTGIVRNVDCAGAAVSIIDTAHPEASSFLQALENPTGFCGNGQMPAGAPIFLTDPNFNIRLPDGSIVTGSQILLELHAWLRAGAPENSGVPVTS